ncbi:MAG: ABC transporter ATP-binding protein [Candidatus Omnitrophica bacterium]|nr:ABC transporter ATP-binding protein [Candidatus Omnitrophota bacterium]
MNILQVSNLKTYFYTSNGVVKAVDDVSFNIEKGKVFGIVGESGSGKTLTVLSILKLISPPGNIAGGSAIFNPSALRLRSGPMVSKVEPSAGSGLSRANEVRRGINGLDLLKLDEKDLRGIRGSKISIVFQEPASSFNPVFTIGEQIVETIINHQGVDGGKAKDLALEYLNRVHIDEEERIFYDYPHQLSGGTKQRAMIAMALVNSPELVILDEPTTALDVTIQAQVLDLLKEIIGKEKLSILFISHDFGIVSGMCDHIAVMRKGRIIESGITKEVLSNPKEPYTVSLLESVKALS